MRRWITKDDIIDVYQRLVQRGWPFIVSKFSLNDKKRTLSAFDDIGKESSNWWMIPSVKSRWNLKITNHPDMTYEDYMTNKYFKNKKNLHLLSIGSGICSHEIALARHACYDKIHCTDIAGSLLAAAEEKATKKGLTNISFEKMDIYNCDIELESYDIVFFHASLHHFKDIQNFIPNIILPLLKKGGYVIINEYVGPDRLQYSSDLIQAINTALKIIPQAYRKRFKSGWMKESVSGSGYLRMVMADPSECIDSSQIIPVLHHHLKVIEEKPYGGNILMPALKDIAHHFVEPTEEKQQVLEELFTLEDNYLLNADSHFIFGIYQKV